MRKCFQELKEMIWEYQNQERGSKWRREKYIDRARMGGREEFRHDIKKAKKAKKPLDGGENSINWEKKREKDINEEDDGDQNHEGNVITITSGSRMSDAVVLSVDCFARIGEQERRICVKRKVKTKSVMETLLLLLLRKLQTLLL